MAARAARIAAVHTAAVAVRTAVAAHAARMAEVDHTAAVARAVAEAVDEGMEQRSCRLLAIGYWPLAIGSRDNENSQRLTYERSGNAV